MTFDGKVTDFDSANRSYFINFKLSSEKYNIDLGNANVQLKIGGTKVNVNNSEFSSMDEDMHKYLKNKLLETIYNYNKAKVSILNELHK
jgi:hypothetical protein